MGADFHLNPPPPPPLREQVAEAFDELDQVKRELSEKIAALSKLRTENDRLTRKVGEQEMELAELREQTTTITLVDPRERKSFTPPEAVRYDEEGYNQWGTKYANVCRACGSATPTNMYGMGSCLNCGSELRS